MEKKNILIVDDSALMRRVESDIIKSDDRFQVLDTATNGLEAFDLVTRNTKKYDAVVLDINMPKMNGIEFLEALEKQKIKQKKRQKRCENVKISLAKPGKGMI